MDADEMDAGPMPLVGHIQGDESSLHTITALKSTEYPVLFSFCSV